MEYGDDVGLEVDIYKDSWPLAKYMTWYIPASVRDAKGVSMGDGSSHSRQFMTQRDESELFNMDQFESDANMGSGFTSRSNTPRPKSRGKNDDLEKSFASVASSLTSLIAKQTEMVEMKTPAKSDLKYIQMYEELDKSLENANFLDAVKFLTETIEKANSKFVHE